MTVLSPAGQANSLTDQYLKNIDATLAAGSSIVVGQAADGAAVTGNPIRIGGKDGSGNTQDIATDTSGGLVLAATEAHLGEVSTASRISIAPTLVVSASPNYSAGDVVGALMTLTNAARVSGGYTNLQSVLITNLAPGVVLVGEILIFDATPAATFTDNSAIPDISGDVAKIVGVVSITSGSYASQTFGASNPLSVSWTNVAARIFKTNASANLFAVLVTTAALDLASTSDIGIRFNFERA